MKKLRDISSWLILGMVLLLLLLLNIFCQDNWLNSDMAAEMIFSRLLSEEHHLFASPNWYYSTEFRVLYTQLCMVPLFSLFKSWHVIRCITNLIFYALLLFSYFYFMRPFQVSRKITVLSSCLLVLPFSEMMLTHMQIGNTYMSHVILIFLCSGMFLRLSAKGKLRLSDLGLFLLYSLLSLICGLSGVRYLLALQCPFVITAFVYLLKSDSFVPFRKAPSKDNFTALRKSNALSPLLWSIYGAFVSVLGYGINVFWITEKYVFQTYDSTNFISIEDGYSLGGRIQSAFGSLMLLLGYIPDRGFLSLRGLVSLSAFALLGIFCFVGCKMKKGKEKKGFRPFFTLFLLISLMVNLFVFFFTSCTMVPRYFITIYIFVLPVLCFYFESREPVFDRCFVALLLGGCLLLGTAKTVYSFASVDKNAIKRPVAQFLEENNYTFGFATYENANIITELTDGAVEIGNITDPESLNFFKWSSPAKYYEEGYHTGETFLLLTTTEYTDYAETKAVTGGQEVYRDDHFVVLSYESTAALMGFISKPEI